ncbi:signal peptide protein, partial [Rhodopirellula maiorica SM1]
MMMMRLIALHCLWIMALALPQRYGNADQTPVARVSSDRDADLISELIRRGDFDTAQRLIRRGLQSVTPNSDSYARQTIWLSELETAQRQTIDNFSDEDILAAQKPIDELITAYPEHPRRLFLRSQRIAVELAAAEHDLLSIMVNPGDTDRGERALRRLTDAAAKSESLSKAVAEEKTRLNSQTNMSPSVMAMLGDLTRLEQETQVQIVQIKLMETELFPASSDDRLAAATAALRSADQALTRLPSDSQARNEVERLRVVALLRSEDFQRARSALSELTREVPLDSDARVRALDIQIDLHSNHHADAKKKLDAFYDKQPANAPLSIEMDLVRLESLLASDDANQNRVGDWIDSIGTRHGAYGRRRAETIAIGSLRSQSRNGSTEGTGNQIDPSIIAAQGRQYLRDGNPLRAAQLLASAAMTETNPDLAIKRSLEAAAAFVAAKQPGDAADILAGVAKLKPAGTGAAAAHLQAVVLKTKTKSPASEIEVMLRTTIALWPDSEYAPQAGNWLIKLLSADKRIIEAAEIATQLGLGDYETALELWRQAFRESESADQSELTTQMKQAFASVLDDINVAKQYRQFAAYFFDRDALSDLAETTTPDDYSETLLQFRRLGTQASMLPAPPANVLPDTVARLMQDGRQNASLRETIANQIEGWPEPLGDSLERAERQIWLGKIEDAKVTV